MIEYNIFPGEAKRIVTFSYDDGNDNDARLIDIFNKYGVKGSFHLNGQKFMGKTEEELDVYRKRYEGHEISCHTLRHGWLDKMPIISVINEVLEDRKVLEHIAGYPVVGMSYPNGAYNDKVIEMLRDCGIVYSRTTRTPYSPFDIPSDFLEWHPTCHHNNVGKYIDDFLDNIDSPWRRPLFYIWGHSYEFRTEEDWASIENVVSRLSGNEKIWYATNIEIYNYVKAQQSLVISADETILYNPSAIPVLVVRNKKEIITVPAGETVRL